MFKQTNGAYKILRPNDPDFVFSFDGVTLIHRAGFELDRRMPKEYLDIIQECLINGWLKPVAYMRDSEYTMELLRK